MSIPSFRETLDSQFSSRFIPLLEKIVGEDGPFLTNLVKNLSTVLPETILDNKRVLHLCCGVGLVSMHLAKRYKVTLIAVDQTAIWIECAKGLAEKAKQSFKGTISYEIHPYDLQRYPEQSFDVVICSRSLYSLSPEMQNNHILALSRVLKPNGLLVKKDLVAPVALSELAKKAFGTALPDSLEKYRELFAKSPFQNIQFVDDTQNWIEYLSISSSYFSAEAPHLVEKHPALIKLLQNRDILGAIFLAQR